MSGIMLTLLGSTFGGAKNFIATFNDEAANYESRSIAVCTDSNDNCYVGAQNVYDSGGQTYQYNWKVSPSGEVLAHKGSRSTDTSLRYGFRNHVKSNGNYVYSFNGDSGTDFVLHELSGDFSTTVAQKRVSTNNSSADFDGAKNILFNPSNDDFYILRWSSSGSEVLRFNSSYSQQMGKQHTFNRHSAYGSPAGDHMYESGGIAFDSSGNIYTGGSFAYFGYEATFHKYNSSGTHQWSRSARNGSQSSFTRGVAVDSSGNPYFVGMIGANDDAAFITKYNSSGTQQWIDLRQDRDQGHFSFTSIHIDSNDNIYVGGSMVEDANGGGFFPSHQHIAVIHKYNTSGTLQWQRGFSYHSNTNFSNQSAGNMPTDITTDSKGNVIFAYAQHSNNSGQNRNSIRLAKIPADGSMTGNVSGGTDGNVRYAATATSTSSVNPDYRDLTRSAENSINRYFIADSHTIESQDFPTDIAEIS